MIRDAGPTFRKCWSILIGTALIHLCFATAQAAEMSRSAVADGQYGIRETPFPLAARSITQSENTNVLGAHSVACAFGSITTDNGYWRLFDLDTDHGLVGDFCTENVDYGIEISVGPQNMTVNVHCLDDGLPFMTEFLTLAGTVTQDQPEAVLEFFNIEVAGCCNSDNQSMAVSLVSDDCVELGTCVSLFIGSNSLGETYSTYTSAPDCGIDEPTPTGDLGINNIHLVMVVNGNDEAEEDDGGDDGGDVPASSGIGVLALGLVLLGAGAYTLLRRRRSASP